MELTELRTGTWLCRGGEHARVVSVLDGKFTVDYVSNPMILVGVPWIALRSLVTGDTPDATICSRCGKNLMPWGGPDWHTDDVVFDEGEVQEKEG